jgi:hypothetical protein
MIIFDLTCANTHRFEGWFASAEDIARQQEAGLLRCPICDDDAITVVPSAKVRVSKGETERAAPQQVPSPTPAQGDPTVPALSAEVIDKLRALVRSTENVGRRFPEEARKIHYEETPARAIRGQASKEEADALRDEGIEFTALPSFLTHETH